MKEKLKKFINNTVVQTISTVIFIGAAAYVGGLYGCNKALNGHHVEVYMEGYEFVKIKDKNEDSIEEEV